MESHRPQVLQDHSEESEPTRLSVHTAPALHFSAHQSAEYASFHERMKSIDWKTEDEEILRAVAEAVANLPPPTTTND